MPAPCLTNFQLVKKVRRASAITQVATAKYMPRILNRMMARISETMALITVPARKPTQ